MIPLSRLAAHVYSNVNLFFPDYRRRSAAAPQQRNNGRNSADRHCIDCSQIIWSSSGQINTVDIDSQVTLLLNFSKFIIRGYKSDAILVFTGYRRQFGAGFLPHWSLIDASTQRWQYFIIPDHQVMLYIAPWIIISHSNTTMIFAEWDQYNRSDGICIDSAMILHCYCNYCSSRTLNVDIEAIKNWSSSNRLLAATVRSRQLRQIGSGHDAA